MTGRLATVAVAGLTLVLGAGVGAGAVGASKVTGADIKDGTVTTKDMKDKTLRPGDFAGGVQLPRGHAGTAGPAGADTSAGYSWVVRTPGAQVPPMATSFEITMTCPSGTTVLGGGGFWEKPLEVVDSRKVVGQQRWSLTLSNAAGNTPVPVIAYAWCAGLTTPGYTTS